MRKSDFALRLQPSLLEEARKLAEAEGVALNQLINATPGAGSGSDSTRIALPTRCTYVSHYEENNRSERGNYGFIGRDLISGKVPHILSANCRHRIGADFKCK